MNILKLALAASGFALCMAVYAAPAQAQSSPIFGLQSVEITPASGVAMPDDNITIKLMGTAGTTLTPQEAVVQALGPTTLEIVLRTTGSAGLTIPTPWTRQAAIFSFPLPNAFGPISPGTYDFYVRGIVGYGTANETVLGTTLAIEDYVVVPEPSAAAIAAIGVVGCGARRAGRRRR